MVQVEEVSVYSKTMHMSLEDSDDEERYQPVHSQSIDHLDLLIAVRKKRKRRRPLKRSPMPKLDQPKLMPQHIARRLPPALQFEARETRRKKRGEEDKARWAGYFENQKQLESEFKERIDDKKLGVTLHKTRKDLCQKQRASQAKTKERMTKHRWQKQVEKEQREFKARTEAHERQLQTFTSAQAARHAMRKSGEYGLVMNMELNLNIALNQKRQACWILMIATSCTAQLFRQRLQEFVQKRSRAAFIDKHAGMIQNKWRVVKMRTAMINTIAESCAMRDIKKGLGWRVQFKIRTIRRRIAARRCRDFFSKHRPQHMCLVFKLFLLRVVKMQRWIRSFLATKAARMVMLRRCWAIIELGLKLNYDVLERRVKERKQQERNARLAARTGKGKKRRHSLTKMASKKVSARHLVGAEAGGSSGGVTWGEEGKKEDGSEDDEKKDEDEDEDEEDKEDRLVSVEKFASISEVLDQFKGARQLFLRQEKKERKNKDKNQAEQNSSALPPGTSRGRKGSTISGRKLAQSRGPSAARAAVGNGGRRGSFSTVRPIAEVRRELLIIEFLRAERIKHATEASCHYRDQATAHSAQSQVIGTVTIEEMRKMVRGEKGRFTSDTIREKQKKAEDSSKPFWPMFMMLTQPECGRMLVDVVGAQLEETFAAEGDASMQRTLEQVHGMESEEAGQGMDDMYAEMLARREEMKNLISGAEQQAKSAAYRRTSDTQTVANEFIRREMRTSISSMLDPSQSDEMQMLEAAAAAASQAAGATASQKRAERKASLVNEIAARTRDELKSRRESQSVVVPEVTPEQKAALAKAEEEEAWRQHQKEHEQKQKQLLENEKKLGNRKRRETKRVAKTKAALRSAK
jgi:hypothetical protein